MSIKVEAQSQKSGLDREKVNLVLFLSGKSISLFGSAIYTFAMGLYLLKTTGSGITFAINIILYTLPLVFINPIAGVIADKMKKNIVVVGSDLINGGFLLIVYLLASKIGLSIPLVYISTFVVTVLATFFNIGIESAKPNLVSKEKLININSIDRLIEASSFVMGPMLGGIVYAFIDIKLFILINALSFLLAAVQEYFIDFQYNKDKINEETYSGDYKKELGDNFWSRMKEGYHYILSRQHLLALVYIFTALNFFFGYSVIVPLPFLLNTTWKIDTSIYGIIQGGLPIGMIIGALFVKKVMARVPYSKLLKILNCLAGLGALSFGIPLIINSEPPNQSFVLIYYTSLMLLSGLIMSWVDIPKNVLLQQIVPGRILGRVISVMMSIGKITAPIAYILSGYLVNHMTPLFLFLSGSILFILFNIWFFTSSLGKKFINISNENLVKSKKL